jgi:hypothetical protein
MMSMIKFLFIFLFLLISASAEISEKFSGTGYFDTWHDGDRASGIGIIEYGAETYPGGFSSGLNVTGSGSYSFFSPDYFIRLDDFNGSVIAEMDSAGTIVDATGSGKLEARSYTETGFLMRGFPSGGMAANGVFEIHSSTHNVTLTEKLI